MESGTIVDQSGIRTLEEHGVEIMKKRSRKLLWIVGALAILSGLGVTGFVVMSRPTSEIDSSRLAMVERGDIARSVVATGRIEPITKVEIKSKANGIIKELKVQVGDVVAPGHILAELDKENLAARVREAKAALIGAESNLKAAEAQLEKNKVEAEGPDVPFTKRNFERAERLLREGVLPQQSYDDARSAHELALNRQNVARAQLTVSEAKVAQAKAEVAQAQAAVDRAEEELNYATIRSPIGGMVLSRDVEIGVVKLNQPSRIKVETFKDRVFDGKVTQISPLGVDKDNVVTFEVKVSINNPGNLLRANMTANAEIVLEEHKGALLVPESAVIYDKERNASVEIPAPGQPKGRERKPIKVGVSNGSRTEVLEGLSEKQQIILQ